MTHIITGQSGIKMSDIDVKALETNFAKWRQDRAPEENEGDAFEVYSIEQILKDSDLSDDEINFGLFGGGDDGGVDGMYLFINRTLILEETEVPESAITVELAIIQAKYTNAFTEVAIQKLHAFCIDCFDWSKPVDSLTYLNSLAQAAIARFRDKYDKVLASPHSFNVSFHYTTKSDYPPHPKVVARVEALKTHVKSKISNAVVDFTFWDCAKLLAAVRTIPRQDAVIEANTQFSTNDGSVVCLVNLNNFASFLTEDDGNLKTSILEPNVRDYQGAGSPVNKEIRATLNDSATKVEFWWLNNGITILAERCSITGNKITITRPEIVNGLQTSHEVFEAFRGNRERKDSRNILLRIIVAPDEKNRNSIIKATNSQTPVSPVSLRATDRLHFDIEDRLKLYGLFYDRRKGEYKRLKKPISKIISIGSLAQSVIAILLQRPSDARARPQTILNREELYGQIFNESYNRDFYAACILLDRQVNAYISAQQNLAREVKVDIRYYVSMLVACELTRNADPDANAIAASVEFCKKPIEQKILENCLQVAWAQYANLGGTDKVAKGPDLQHQLKAMMKRKFSDRTEELKF